MKIDASISRRSANSKREERWWLMVGARWEARQHLGEEVRAAIIRRLKAAAAEAERWAFCPSVWVGLFDEAWMIHSSPEEAMECCAELPVGDQQAVGYARWVLGMDSRPAPNEVTDLHRDAIFDLVLGERAERDCAILDLLLGIASNRGHPDRALATASLYQAAGVGNVKAIDALFLSAIEDMDDVQGAALTTLADAAASTGNPGVVDALCWLAADPSYPHRRLAILALGQVEQADRSCAMAALEAIGRKSEDPDRALAQQVLQAVDSRLDPVPTRIGTIC